MFQLSINNNSIGEPMLYQEGVFWQNILAATFPDEVVWLKRINDGGQYVWDQVDSLVIFPLEKGEAVKI